MTKKFTHTPTPWKLEPLNPYILGGPHELGICQMIERETNSETMKANAAFIVRAVNNHDRLFEILTVLKDCFEDVEGERENFQATISKETLLEVEQALAAAQEVK